MNNKSKKNTKQKQNEKKIIRKLNNESRKPIVTWFIVHTTR